MALGPVVQIVLGLLLASFIMTVLWLVQRKTLNAGIVDVGWAAGIGILGLLFAVTSDGYPSRRVLVGAMIGIWSLRLAVHLLTDRVVGHPEEGRYQTLREKWGSKTDRNLLIFFQVQAVLALLFALPVLAVAHNKMTPLTIWGYLGVVIWVIAVGCTALADWQLADFKRRPESRGKTCREGLWRYSRHPNYFFEWLHWWAYAALAVGSTYWWIPVVAPLVMLFFLLKVTGIPPTEAQALASRGDDYREYQRTTSAFVPWFPKREAARDGSDRSG
jgi:steroid 5-alpha reductase family enzyme